LIDHHRTAESLNKYSWANVEVEKDGIKQCGTTLFYEYLVKNNLISESKLLDDFVETVRSYDTWDWVKSGNLKAKNLSSLCKFYGCERFTEQYFYILNYQDYKNIVEFDIDKDEIELLSILDEKIKYLIDGKLKKLKKFSIDGNSVGIVFCDNIECTSLLGEEAFQVYPELDYCCIIYDGGIALRSHSEGEFDVSEIAKKLGGGGHKNAAGCRLNENTYKYFELYFKN
jgi:hypothetical protein